MYKFKRAVVLYRQHPTQASRKVRDINYPAELIENALARYGLSGPGGVSASAHEVDAALAMYWDWHACAHLGHGRYVIGLRALYKSLSYQLAHMGRLRLFVFACLGLGRPYVRWVINRKQF